MEGLTYIAAAGTASGGVFGALGIDWQMLVFQIIAFLILVWFLGKFVYPPLIKIVDKRQAQIEESAKATAAAEEKAAQTKAEMDKLLKQARAEASDIVTTAKEEATAALEKADKKAKERAERTLADAHEQIEKDIVAAKKALHNETLSLVTQATEKVLGKSVTATVDDTLVASAIKESK